MKKRKKIFPQTLALLLLSSSFQMNPSVAFASPSPTTPSLQNNVAITKNVNEGNREEELTLAQKQMEKAGSYQKQRQLVENAIDNFKKNTNSENLKKAIDLLLFLPVNADGETDKLIFTNTILTLVSFVPENEKENLLSHFAKEAVNIAQKTKLVWDFEMAKAVVQKLSDEKQKKGYLSLLDKLEPKVYDKNDPNTGYIDWDTEDGIYSSHIDHAKDNFKPGYNASIIREMLKKPKDNVPTFSAGTFWIEPSKEFRHIDIPEPEARQKKWELLFNGIINGDHHGGSSGSGRIGFSNNSDASAFESSLTIQYTFDVHSDSPYFYDTGIRIRKDYTIEYDKAKDALYQIAIHSKGRFVEDNNRALGVIDGRIIVIEDKGKLIPVSEFLHLFDVASNVKVKVLDTRIGQSKTLVDLVETKGVTTVWVKDQEIELSNPAIVDNSIVLFPIKDIAKALGGKVKQDDKQTIVTFNGDRLIFEDGKSYALYNDRKVSLKVPTRITQKGVRVASIYPMLNMFDASISVDTKTNRVIITTK